MKIHTDCVPCLLKRTNYETALNSSNNRQQQQILKQAIQLLASEYNPDECSAVIATKLHRLVYKLLDNLDPYEALKKESNKVALKLIPDVQKLIDHSDDAIEASMLCATIGNMMDFGIEGASKQPKDILTQFTQSYCQGFGYSDYILLKNHFETARNLLYFTDNSGEIVFDKLLCQQLKLHYPSINITLIVKGEPVLSDATRIDVNDLSMDEVVDLVETTGCFAVGVNVECFSNRLKEACKKADIILCKGMANFESFSEFDYRPIVYLMRTKCQPIADDLGVPVHANILKLFE